MSLSLLSLRAPKGPSTYIGSTWALKYLLFGDLTAQVHKRKVHGPSGLGYRV